MKTIEIHSQRFGIKQVLVDDEDYEKVCHYNWYIIKVANTLYVTRRVKGRLIYLHRFILNLVENDSQVDHADNNGLNNQRSNIRLATSSQNCHNVPARGKSQYKGVTLHHKRGWFSRIKCNYKSYWLGHYPITPCGELMAAIAYDSKAIDLYGDRAVLNFK